MSGGWTTTPPRADEPRPRPRARWWLLLGAFLLLVVVLLAWRPWAGSQPVASPSGTSGATSSATLPPLPPLPSPSLTASPEPSATPPGTDTVFDVAGAQALFVTADQIAGALPTAVGTVTPSPVAPASSSAAGQSGWGLPSGGSVAPASCLVARTVVATKPAVGYESRSWTGEALTYRQEVTLLRGADEAHRAFATLVGTVDACAQYTETEPSTGTSRWTTQPAIEGAGLYPSIVQQVQLQSQGTTTNGYRGHLLVGNAIVTWTAWTTGDVDTLGSPDGLSGIVQDRALAAVRAVD